jgi:nickel/cobalt exporter
VLAVGTGVLRARLRTAQCVPHHHHAHDDHHDHRHGPDHGHGHHHHHDLSRRGVIAMGASAGLIPCPSALVVLLGAIAQHQVGLGLLLIVAFSAGLAATLTALGIAVVHAARLTTRVRPASRVVAALPAASAVVIVAAGALLTARALPGVLA